MNESPQTVGLHTGRVGNTVRLIVGINVMLLAISLSLGMAADILLQAQMGHTTNLILAALSAVGSVVLMNADEVRAEA